MLPSNVVEGLETWDFSCVLQFARICNPNGRSKLLYEFPRSGLYQSAVPMLQPLKNACTTLRAGESMRFREHIDALLKHARENPRVSLKKFRESSYTYESSASKEISNLASAKT